MAKTDILILCHNKDANKITYVVESINHFIKPFNGIGDIHVVSNVPSLISCHNIHIHDENDVVKKVQFQHRSGWVYQQIIKLLQTVTTDNYLSVDADVFFNKPIHLYDNGKPCFFLGREQHHSPYFLFMDKMGIKHSYTRSFINEIMLFQRKKIEKMIGNRNEFLSFCQKEITPDCYLSEFELYGNYIHNNYPDEYLFKQLNAPVMGKSSSWTNEEIESSIKEMSIKDVDLFTLHTWT